jgi:glycosyltransferase involved in cell wall biosynthesis
MKLLTVTVPCYNSQDYMEKCLDSLLTGGERVEIIVIDDGSRDDTGAIADDYARRYPSIVRVIHQENGGHGEGINQGLKAATGLYFKVVDSDDVLSADFPAFLDTLEECGRNRVDLVLTNYYYVHSDGVGDKSLHYTNALPVGRVFGWEAVGTFQPYQLLTIHSCTFRREIMERWAHALPKHVFYEDNLMVYQTLPHVERMYYMNVDLYRYWIGRPDQSVQRSVMLKRYRHQLLVTQMCFTSCRLDDLREKKLRKYLRHELFVMFGISILYARLNRSLEADAAMEEMFGKCREFDQKWADHFRYRSVLRLICIPGTFGRNLAEWVYGVSNRILRFN